MNSIIEILLVEDDHLSVELAREALKDSGIPHNLTVVSDGETAIHYVRKAKPQFILLDLNLPKKNGLEVLKEIKSDPNLRWIPTIMLTNSRSQEDVLKAYHNYCNAYVRKPLGFDMLVETIKATGKFWFDIATLPEEPSLPPPSSNPPLSIVPNK